MVSFVSLVWNEAELDVEETQCAGNMDWDMRKLKWEYPGWFFVYLKGLSWVIQISLHLTLKGRMFLGDAWSRENNGDEVVTVEAGYEPIAKTQRQTDRNSVVVDNSSKPWNYANGI